jgi:hypothetical protein
MTHMERSVNAPHPHRSTSTPGPHTERVRIAGPEKISRRIVQRQQRQSRLPAATKLSRSEMDVVVVLEARTMSLSSSRAKLLSRAASRSPARAIAMIASGGEGRGARPRAADEQLVGGGQGGCVLPRVERGACNIGGEVRAGRRERGYEVAASACTGPDSQKAGGQGHARSARRTCSTWS